MIFLKKLTYILGEEIMKNLIELYIHNMTSNDIKNFLVKNNYPVNEKDIDTVFFYIKNNWEPVVDGDTSIFEEIKPKISDSSYQTMISLYNQYKNYL